MPAGTYADPLLLNMAEGVHNIDIVWHDEEWWAGFPYPVCFMKAATAQDALGLAWTLNAAYVNLELNVFYDEVEMWAPGENSDGPDPMWYGNEAWSWNLNPGPFSSPIFDTVYDPLPVYFVLMDWGADPGINDPIGAVSLEYEVVVPFTAAPLPGNGITWTRSDPIQLAKTHAQQINIGGHIFDLPGVDQALIVHQSYGECHVAVFDYSSASVVAEETAATSMELFGQSNWHGFLAVLHLHHSVILEFRYNTTYLYKKVTVTNGAISVASTPEPDLISAVLNSPSWIPFLDGTLRGILFRSYLYAPRVVELDEDGNIVDEGPPVIWPGGLTTNFNFWLPPQACPDDPSRYWVMVDNWDSTVLPERFGIGRLVVSGMNLTFDTEILSEVDETLLSTQNSGTPAVISKDLLLHTYDAADDRFDDSTTWGGYAGYWVQPWTVSGATLIRGEPYQIFKTDHEIFAGFFQTIDFSYDEGWYYYGTLVAGNNVFLLGEEVDVGPYISQDGYNGENEYEINSYKYASIKVTPEGEVAQGSVYDAPPTFSPIGNLDATQIDPVRGLVLSYDREQTSGPWSRYLFTWTANLVDPDLDGNFRAGDRTFDL